MKKLTMTMQEFYNEFSPLAKSEGIQYSFERNKNPILSVLKEITNGEKLRVLEVGSGNGLHAEFFAKNLPASITTLSMV